VPGLFVTLTTTEDWTLLCCQDPMKEFRTCTKQFLAWKRYHSGSQAIKAILPRFTVKGVRLQNQTLLPGKVPHNFCFVKTIKPKKSHVMFILLNLNLVFQKSSNFRLWAFQTVHNALEREENNAWNNGPSNRKQSIIRWVKSEFNFASQGEEIWMSRNKNNAIITVYLRKRLI